jgi:hypothetical protein
MKHVARQRVARPVRSGHCFQRGGVPIQKWLTVAAALLLLGAVLAPGAGADLSSAPTSGSIELLCGSDTVTIITNGNGIWSPGHDADTTAIFIPTALNVVLTFTPADGGPPLIDHAIVSKDAPIEETVMCSIPLQTLFTTDAGTMTITGTFTGIWTPR